MAKGGAGDMSDVSEWCDIKLLEAAFKRVCKTDAATLSELKKIINDSKVYNHIQVTPFSTHSVNKKLSLAKFKSKMWFEAMTKGDAAAAQKLAQKICAEEQAKQEKDAKGTKKGDDVTSRLTDTSKYTGAHKERFDAEGKGKGSSGRVDKVDSSGYVGNYKGEGSYGKK